MTAAIAENGHDDDQCAQEPRQRSVHVVIEDDAVHVRDRFGGCENLSGGERCGELLRMGNEADRRIVAEDFLPAGGQRADADDRLPGRA